MKIERIKYVINLVINEGISAGAPGVDEYWYVPEYLYSEGVRLFKDYYSIYDRLQSHRHSEEIPSPLSGKLAVFIKENREVFDYFRISSHDTYFSYQGKYVCFVSDDSYREAGGILKK